MTAFFSPFKQIVMCALALMLLQNGVRCGEKEATVPPEGVAPFAPAPLMDKVRARITADKFRFVVVGDVKHAPTFPALVKYMEEKINPDFVLTTGDMVASGGGKVGAGYYEKLATENGESFRKCPWWPAIGNHEIAGDPITGKHALENDSEKLQKNHLTGLENFKHFYGLEKEYYSFECRNSVFIALPFPLPHGESEKWLEDTMAAASTAGKHIFVFDHEAFYTVGQKTKAEVPNKETDLTRLFEKNHVRAVFSGHDHGYYRTIRNGVPYMISAGGGAPIYFGARFGEALPEDVYYYAVPEKNPDVHKKYILHDGANGKPDKFTDKADQFMIVVDVDGAKVTAFCVTATGERWDDITLSK